jgi:hypothetical protein
MDDARVLSILKDIRNWIRAASYQQVKGLLKKALHDSKSRKAYQMLDGRASMEQVRIACKMSPNGLLALVQKCTAMGLMETNVDKKRARLFDLGDFNMFEDPGKSAKAKE